MADVRLKDPNSDFVAVVGSPIEAANLRARGYTDVDDEPTGDGPQAKLDGTETGGNGESSEGSAGGEGQPGSSSQESTPDASASTKPSTQRGSRAPK